MRGRSPSCPGRAVQPGQVHLEPHLCNFQGFFQGRAVGSPPAQLHSGPLRSWRWGPDLTEPSAAPTDSVFSLALGVILCSLASLQLGSLLGLMGLGQVWMGQALIHGLENPSLVICQLPPRPGLVTDPPTSPQNPVLGALEGH